MPKRIQPFKLSSADRLVLQAAANDLTLFTKYYFDWTPIPWQHDFYHAPQKDKLVVAGIRSGKTKLIAAAFCHYAIFHPGCRLANASISADQANIVFNDILDFAQRPRFQHFIRHVQIHPYPKIEFHAKRPNEEVYSEIWCRSAGYEGQLWRGWEFDWINYDEVGYEPSEITIRTLQGRLLGVGRAGLFTMTTSPKGKTWLFERWKLGDPAYYGSKPEKYLSIRARTRDNIYLKPEDIEELEEKYTERMKQQELEGLFVDSEGAQFSYQDVMKACEMPIYDERGVCISGRPEVGELSAEVDAFRNAHGFQNRNIDYYALQPEPGHLYVQSWDLGKRPNKKGRNANVGGVLDISAKPWRLVAYRYAPGSGWGDAHQWIKQWHDFYNQGGATCETIIDATGKGDVLNEQIYDEDRIDVEGFVYTSVSKPQLVQALALTLERGEMIYPFIRQMVDQLQGYELPDDRIAQDIVMMLGQAAVAARRRTGDLTKATARPFAQVGAGRHPMDHPQMTRYAERRTLSRQTRSQRVR